MKKITLVFLSMIFLITSCGKESTPSWQEQYDLGMKYLSEENYEEAIVEFVKAIELEANQVEVYLALAEAYIKIDDIDSALQILREGHEQTGDERLQKKHETIRAKAEEKMSPIEKMQSHLIIDETIFDIKILGINFDIENMDAIAQALANETNLSREEYPGDFTGYVAGEGWMKTTFGSNDEIYGKVIELRKNEIEDGIIPKVAQIQVTDTGRMALKKLGFTEGDIEQLEDMDTLILEYVDGNWKVSSMNYNTDWFCIRIAEGLCSHDMCEKEICLVFGEGDKGLDMAFNHVYFDAYFK